jgi:hypothetical protein
MEMYDNMDFVKQVKSNLVVHTNLQVRNYIIMMVKITLDHYQYYPIRTSRWMDFSVILPLRPILGNKIMIEIRENQDIYITKFNK